MIDFSFFHVPSKFYKLFYLKELTNYIYLSVIYSGNRINMNAWHREIFHIFLAIFVSLL